MISLFFFDFLRFPCFGARGDHMNFVGFSIKYSWKSLFFASYFTFFVFGKQTKPRGLYRWRTNKTSRISQIYVSDVLARPKLDASDVLYWTSLASSLVNQQKCKDFANLCQRRLGQTQARCQRRPLLDVAGI